MKYNKLLKKALALGLVATMAAVPAPIMAARDAEIVVDNLTEKGVIDVELPTALVFAIDPMEISSNGNGQITSSDLIIYNRSNFPIRVDATTSLTFTDDVKLHPAKNMSEEKRFESTTEKHIYFGVSVMKSAVVNTIAADTKDIALEDGVRDVALTYTSIKDNIKNPTATPSVDSLEAEVTKYGAGTSIILNEAKLAEDGTTNYTDADKARAAESLGAVKFVGLVNPNADWKAGDITANMVFDISGVSSLVYDLAINGKAESTSGANDGIDPELLGGSKVATRIQKGVDEKLPKALIANPTVDETDPEDVKIAFTLEAAAAESKVAVKPTRVKDIMVSSGVTTADDGTEEAYDIAWDAKSFTSTYDATTKKISVVMAGKDVPDVETAKAQLTSITTGVHNVKLVYDNGTEQVIKIDFTQTPAAP